MVDDNNERRDVEIYIRRPKPSRPGQTFDDQQELDDFLKNQNLFVTFDELIQEHGLDLPLLLSGARGRLRKDNNVVSAVEAMTLCKVMSLYPPADIMDWIYQAFWDFQKDDSQLPGENIDRANQYKGDMNKFLGVSGPGNPINTALRRKRNEYVYDIMGVLKGKLGISVRSAAELICNREVVCKSWPAVGMPDPETLQKGYGKLNPKPHEVEGHDYLDCQEHAEGFVDSFDIRGANADVIKKMREQIKLLPFMESTRHPDSIDTPKDM